MRAKDNLRTAQAIALQNGQGSYTGQLDTLKPNRLFKVRLNQRSSLNLSLTGLQADANLTLLNRNGKMLRQAAQPGTADESIAYTAKPGTYYIRVSGQAGSTPYQLSLATNASQAGRSLSATQTGTVPSDPLIAQVVELTNSYRAQAGLAPLRYNPLLSVAAQQHSQDMALNDFFSHSGSNGSTPFDRITQAGYNYFYAAENVAAGFATPGAAMQGWMNSPGHRANILSPLLTEIGVGFYALDNDTGSTNYRYYWTQDFGNPMK